MTFDIARIADPLFVSENRLAAHSDHRWHQRTEGDSEQLLSGTWRFHYAEHPDDTVDGFADPSYDVSAWDEIAVPGHIQLQGYGRPQYTNVQYPWDGLEDITPGEVPAHYNPVGSYVRAYTLDRPLAPGERLSVAFLGAETAIAVWHNGVYVGYATDSFTPSEFDLTDTLVEGENRLAAQVFKVTSGAWLEDQDFYRFSGLFRDVVLRRRPRVHVEDIHVTTDVAADLRTAVVRAELALAGSGSVTATLSGHGSEPLALADAGDGVLSVELEAPRLWHHEDPYLHELAVEVRDETGAVTERFSLAVGVRRFGIEDGLLRINGERVVLLGVNRHEFGVNGRVITREETEADLRLLKAAGVNALRTSHYPNNSFFYELTDRYGFYVIDEMNLETHAMWDAVVRGRLTVDEALPGDRADWLPALLDRAASMVGRDRNHASVVMWSCGNESFGGADILAVADWFRSVDTRPVHYEGVHWDPRHPETSDVVSRMYASVTEIEEYLATHRDKPYVLCEYAHAMGNSFGAVDKYIDLAYREPLFQGAFVWDFADQGIALTDPDGRPYVGYGGDAGEAPHDGEFCGNGLVFLDRTPTPKYVEMAQLYQPLHVTVDADGVTVRNRHLFTASGVYAATATLAREGVVLTAAPFVLDVAPGASGSVPLPVAIPDQPGEYTVDVAFALVAETDWAPAGHVIASAQGVFAVEGEPRAASAPALAPQLIDGIHNFGVRGEGFTALFSKLHGGLVSYRAGHGDAGRELLRSVPKPSFWHAPTSNERGWDMPARDGQWLLASRYATVAAADPADGAENPTATVVGDAIEVAFRYALPTTPASESTVVYRVGGDGRIDVRVTARPGEGLPDMPEFGLMIETDAAFGHLRWYGEGPHESYVDRRASARLGVWEAEVADLLTPYLRPQEAGSRTGVRWAEVTGADGFGLRLECAEGMELSALPWTPYEIENAAHPVDLPPIRKTVLRPALMRRGVGGDDSWGARTHPEHLLPTGELEFAFTLRAVRPE